MRSDVPEFDMHEEAIPPHIKELIVSESATLNCTIHINRQMWLGMVYGSKTFWWPVSNSWLRLHGYPVKHYRQHSKLWYNRVYKKGGEKK